MEVKKYIGEDTQDALAKLKKDLGSEAVILNTRTIRQKGFLGFFKKPVVEIIAAKDNSHKKINKIKREEGISDINSELRALRNLVEDMAFKSNNTGETFNVNLEKYRRIL
ncbi:hypothetical protein L0P56_10070, partial [Anaerosalibacter bizertensis]|nr:hypothetical protein [Anaerosalibacter bizertensis]